MNAIRKKFILLLCLLFPCASLYPQVTDTPRTESANANSQPASPIDPSILQYLNQITEQEKLHGAYDPQLSEQLLGLGLLYQNQKQYVESGKVLNRALHIKKINDGLQSMTQVPVLDALIKTNTAARNWDELDKNYYLLLWVHQRNLKSGDPALLPVILAVGRWKLEAYSNSLLSDSPAAVLTDLKGMFQTTVDIMEDLYGENDPRLTGPLKILSLTGYQQITLIDSAPIGEFEGFGNRVSFQQVCQPVFVNGRLQMVCYVAEVPNPNFYVSKQQTKDLRMGEQMNSVRSLLSRIVKISDANPGMKPSEKAAALVNLGDWYFINNKSVTAIENYKKANQILATDNTDRDSAKKLFDQPVRIPVMTTALPGADNTPAEAVKPPFVKLSFDVTTDGRAKNIQVIEESEPKNVRTRKTAIQLIKTSMFRPQLREGEPVATKAAVLLLSGAILQKGFPQNSDRNRMNSATKLQR